MDKMQLPSSGAVFDCRMTAAMGEAYDKACRSMQDWGQPEIMKKTIAKRIIEVAQRGESDPDQICDQALKSLGFSESQVGG
jgi:molybdopterin-biosynthesis enzyme MoeA-like protein